MKTSVTSAPTKADSSKAIQASMPWKKGDWLPSMVTTSELESLAANGLLPPHDLCAWRAPSAKMEPFPLPDTNEQVVMVSLFEWGLGLPVHDFLRGLLHHYGAQLHHLTPNGILHISCFVTLCEAFLGIYPHWGL